MSTTQDKDALVAAMTGVNATANWDVLVSYSVTKLNALLPSLWVSNSTFTQVPIDFDYPGFGFRMHADFTLGSPTLQFAGGQNGVAILVMPISGMLRKDQLIVDPNTGDTTGSIEGKDKDITPVQAGRYVLQASVPLASMDGNASSGPEALATVQDGSKPIVFDDLKTNTCRIVFHFHNSLSTYKILNAPGAPTTRDPNAQVMSDMTNKLANYFQDPQKVNSLDYALATVQRTVNAQDSAAVLLPESFIFRTAGADPGVLCVYIKTKGSDNPVGISSPAFQPNNNDISPIPQGYTASIIIRKELFSNKYLIPELKSHTFTGGLIAGDKGVQENTNFAAGFQYHLTMAPAVLNSTVYGPGPWQNKKLNCNYDFADQPLQLTLSGGKANWFWQFEDRRYDWSRWDNNLHGKVYFDVHLNKDAPIATVTDEDVALQVDLQHGDFNLWVHPYNAGPFDLISWGAGWTNSLPQELSTELYMDINALKLSNQNFNFFATQNIFAPGKKIIKVDSSIGVFAPHDVLLLGDVVDPPAAVPPPAGAKALVAHIDDATDDAPPSQTLSTLKSTVFTDQAFVTKLFAALRDNKLQDFEQAVNDKGITVSADDLDTLHRQASSQPEFDIRLAAGLYKIDAPTGMNAMQMTISPMDGMISFDSAHVENQVTDTDTGKVSFTTSSGANLFECSFKSSFDDDGNVSAVQFDGQTWPSGQADKKLPFTGSKVIPQANKDDGSGWFGSATAQGISFTLACIGLTGLSFMTLFKKIQEHRRAGHDPQPVIDAAHPAVSNASAVADAAVHASLAANPLAADAGTSALIVGQARAAARQASSLASAPGASGDPAAALAAVEAAVSTSVQRSAQNAVEVEMGSLFNGALEILPAGGADVVAEQSRLRESATAPPNFVRDLSADALVLSQRQAATLAAQVGQGRAIAALLEKQEAAQQLQSEKAATDTKVQAIKERAARGAPQPDDEAELAELTKKVQAQEAALEAAQKAQADAEAVKEAADAKASEAQKDEKAAKDEMDGLEPNLDDMHDVPIH